MITEDHSSVLGESSVRMSKPHLCTASRILAVWRFGFSPYGVVSFVQPLGWGRGYQVITTSPNPRPVPGALNVSKIERSMDGIGALSGL